MILFYELVRGFEGLDRLICSLEQINRLTFLCRYRFLASKSRLFVDFSLSYFFNGLFDQFYQFDEDFKELYDFDYMNMGWKKTIYYVDILLNIKFYDLDCYSICLYCYFYFILSKNMKTSNLSHHLNHFLRVIEALKDQKFLFELYSNWH